MYFVWRVLLIWIDLILIWRYFNELAVAKSSARLLPRSYLLSPLITYLMNGLEIASSTGLVLKSLRPTSIAKYPEALLMPMPNRGLPQEQGVLSKAALVALSIKRAGYYFFARDPLWLSPLPVFYISSVFLAPTWICYSSNLSHLTPSHRDTLKNTEVYHEVIENTSRRHVWVGSSWTSSASPYLRSNPWKFNLDVQNRPWCWTPFSRN